MTCAPGIGLLLVPGIALAAGAHADIWTDVEVARVGRFKKGSGLPLRLAILVYLQGLLNAFLSPVFMTLLYLERKRRASEASAAGPAAMSP